MINSQQQALWTHRATMFACRVLLAITAQMSATNTLLFAFVENLNRIVSGLGFGRYSKSNNSDSKRAKKKTDRDIPTYNLPFQMNHTDVLTFQLTSKWRLLKVRSVHHLCTRSVSVHSLYVLIKQVIWVNHQVSSYLLSFTTIKWSLLSWEVLHMPKGADITLRI